MTNVVLFSGGPDSLITLRKIRQFAQDVVPVYFDLGHVYAKQEKAAIAQLAPETIQYSFLRSLGETEESDAYMPHRNAHLIIGATKALGECVLATIWLTVQKDELTVSDRSMEFLTSMNTTLRCLTGKAVSVETPWATVDKTDMVAWFLQSGGKEVDLRRSWSCYKSGPVQCGNCAACFRRYVAFKLNGIEEEYDQRPWLSATADAYRAKALEGTYSPERSRRILDALGDSSHVQSRGAEG